MGIARFQRSFNRSEAIVMEQATQPTQDASFLAAIKAGHVFFFDLELDEVVHFRRDIYEAAQLDDEGMDLDLTTEEEADAEDAWEIIEDQVGRYEAMPMVSEELATRWEKEFEASGKEDRENFLAEKVNLHLLAWLDSFNAN
jgi:hypothetical protein